MIATGGTPGYEYSLNNGLPQSTPTFSNLSSNDYILSVKDANGCPCPDDTIKLGEPGEIILTSTYTDLSCYQSGDGKLEIVFGDPLTQTYGGQKPYTYILNIQVIIQK